MAEYLPAPPARLRQLAPRDTEVLVLRAGTPVWRIYRSAPHGTKWSDFRRHGPLDDARFDHHLDNAPTSGTRSILYAAEHPMTCIAEAFQRNRRIQPFTDAPRLAHFAFRADLRLLDVAGTWITRAGGSLAISAGRRATARRWSRAIHDAFPDIHGLRYASSKNAGEPCYAFYERAEALLRAEPSSDVPLAHPDLEPLLEDAARTLGYRRS